MNIKRLILLIFSLLLIIGGSLAYNLYQKIYAPNTVDEGYLYIPTNSNFEQVENLVRPFLKRVKPFRWVAKKKSYVANVKSGRYFISNGMNNNELVNLLRSGKQDPVKLTFNNLDTLEKLAAKISLQIEGDSLTLISAFNNNLFLTEAGFAKPTAIGMYIPNTYEIYWNTTAEGFRNIMLKEYNRFWNTSRLEKAKSLNLSEDEVITLASIVQKETAMVSERPTVAGLYLNRLGDNWPLQADPTIIYALKKKYGENTSIRRVLKKDLNIASPYNTYKNTGLPPGPIGMPDISSIDAVLNFEKHNYYYMCASVTNMGSHAFAKTLAQHNKNAAKYQKWISGQGIDR